ncbi:MAG: AAA-like domain-containing protein [Lachnospiraceae bacterium]|nr:AAA-like domain-containing protein [Lachnospiraceae bacterium]
MPKVFNTTAVCIPEEHYMIDLSERLGKTKALVAEGKYFTINRARQYGKTTMLMALERFLKNEYYVISMDFQTFDKETFENSRIFSMAFADSFCRELKKNTPVMNEEFTKAFETLKANAATGPDFFTLRKLFEELGDICLFSAKPIVLTIDEVDSASNNQVFLDFLAQLRAQYIRRFSQPAFKSVILAGVYDIKNLRHKIRPNEDHKYNSPWNIAADFKIDMSFSQTDIAGMLCEYENDYHTGMDIDIISGLLCDYTSGYPFLISRLCQLMDEDISIRGEYGSRRAAWTPRGFFEAVRLILSEKNTLFESFSEKLNSYPELNNMLYSLLFTGKAVTYNYYEPSINIATLFGLVKDQNGLLVLSNRIFETWLYNLYLSSSELQRNALYSASLLDKSQFITNGRLNMRLILEKFTVHFNDLYGDRTETFIEEEGRKFFLLYLRPIINGTGNYYVEAQTRHQKRTDVIVDYHGEQYIIEMKIWHGQEYHTRGEKQLTEYLDAYHIDLGYMISFNFNQNKQIGVHDVILDNKRIVEAIV